ncbi:hypothetical protein GCM10011591_29150 [Nocardia camponoti]|uniref:MFS transporter n=1 Tax=Nocardia camponoti TaxID=1616106 RepID=A0A917QKX2_9NOCA|nr:hypothetical protein GCM10011591_29150 [Nocardia camponoti]
MRGLRLRAVAFKGSRDLLPIYGLYGVFFADHGLSTAQISLLLAIWSVTAFVLEVPSGAWADTVSRRGLLILSGLLQAAVFAIWLLAPSFGGFAVGFVVWGIAGSIESGTFEALLYDDLVARDAVGEYASIMGWARAAQEATVLVAIASAGPLYAWGGYALVGWVSVGFAVLHMLTAVALPSAPVAVSVGDVEGLEDGESGPLSGAIGSPVTEPPRWGSVVMDEADPVAAPPAAVGGQGRPSNASCDVEPSASDSAPPTQEPPVAECAPTPRSAAPTSAAPVIAAPVTAAPTAVTPASAASVAATPLAAAPISAAPVKAAPTTVAPVTATPATAIPIAATSSTAAPSTGEVKPSSARGSGEIGRASLPGILQSYVEVLRVGIDEALRVKRVRRGVLLGALLYGITAFDEYFGLLAVSGGASAGMSAVLLGVVVVGSLVGSTLAGRAETWSARVLSVVLFAGGAIFIAGALVVGIGWLWVGFVAIGIGYGADFTAEVVAGARLQEAIESRARATVTSISGLLSEIVALAVFGFVALTSTFLSMSLTMALLGVILLLGAVMIPTWLPPRAD